MIIYILKFSACLALFLVFYKFVLEKEDMHVFKRFYLIGAMLVSLGIPFITFTYYIAPGTEVIAQITESLPLENSSLILETPTDYLPIILWSIYGFGLLLFGFKFIKNLLTLSYKIKRNPKQKIKSITNVLLQDSISPHTFFNYIFFNKEKYDSQQIPQEVIWHEQTHATQKHSIDVVFVELLQVIFWFNPLIYIIKHVVKLNHEFLADQAVINKGVETASYQQTLLAFSSNAQHPQLANAINYSLIKKRFTVMKTKTTKRGVWLRSLVILPLLALSLYSFSTKEVIEKEPLEKSSMELDNFYSQEDIIITQDIHILIDTKGQLLVNDHFVKIENLLSTLESYNTDIPFGDRNIIKVTLSPDANTPMGIVSDVKKIIKTYNVPKVLIKKQGAINSQKRATTKQVNQYNTIIKKLNSYPENKRIIKLSDVEILKHIYSIMTAEQKKKAELFPTIAPPPAQEKATKKQVAEYNSLAKKYNEMPKDHMIIKSSDIKRLKYLYSIMTDDQKKNAEAFPNIPTPPSPPVPTKVSEAHKNAQVKRLKAQKEKLIKVREIRTEEDRKRLKEVKLAQRESQVAARVLKLKSQKGALVKVREIRTAKLKEEKLAQRESQVAARVLKLKSQKGELVKVREIRTAKLKEEKLAQRESKAAARMLKLKSQKGELVEIRNVRAAKLKEEQLAQRESRVAAKVLKYKAQKAKRIKVREVPPPPPPKSPIEHIKDMTNKGATFIYDGKSVSSKKALQLIRSNKKLNIMTKHSNNKNYVVTLSKRPIVVED